jgi:hypothetical protein
MLKLVDGMGKAASRFTSSIGSPFDKFASVLDQLNEDQPIQSKIYSSENPAKVYEQRQPEAALFWKDLSEAYAKDGGRNKLKEVAAKSMPKFVRSDTDTSQPQDDGIQIRITGAEQITLYRGAVDLTKEFPNLTEQLRQYDRTLSQTVA